MRLKVGTRGSPLALLQTQLVLDALRQSAPALEFELITLRTEGDRNRHDSLTTLGGRGVFVREIEERLLGGEIDCAVHSLKDLPSTQPVPLALAALLPRADARDVMVARDRLGIRQLPHGARVGSSSPRRAAQLLALRPDLQIMDIRGNVDTRLRKLDDGQYDAIVLAAAGLLRMGLGERITHYFSADEMLPAAGQGALVAECRADDAHTLELLASVDDAPTRVAGGAERALLRGLGGGCQLPIAAYGQVDGTGLYLRGLVAQPGGERIVRDAIRGDAKDGEALGARLAQRLWANGARELMDLFDAQSKSA
jgi:hydroxymethylbilane synthase